MRWRALSVDALVAGAAFALSALILASRDAQVLGLRDPDAAAYGLLALYSASVVIRRRAPVVAVAIGLLSGAAYAAANYPLALTPVALLPIYTAAALLPQRPGRLVLAGAMLVGMVGSTLGPGPTNTGVPALIACAWLLGNYVGTRRAYAAELESKNRQLELARVELAERAVAEERLRIARELHDVVAHSMSVVALHAGTGRMVAQDNPAGAQQALATIETATRSALGEMRRLLGVLRGSNGEQNGVRSPAPGLGDLDALVAEVVRSGVTVEVCIDGEPRGIPTGVDLSAYRIVQEALTNVIKHAGRARTKVAIRYSDGAVSVEIADDGAEGSAPRPAEVSAGHGITGMRERVALYHGDFDAGFRPGGGFLVAARLLYEARP